MPSGTIFIIDRPAPYEPVAGNRVEVGGIELGTITRVENLYDGEGFTGRVYVEWDRGVELGSFQARRETT